MTDFIRSVNLPLKVLETASGGAVPEQKINRGSDDDTEDDPTKKRKEGEK